MKRHLLKGTIALLLISFTNFLYAQNSVGIGTETPNPRAVLELISPTNDQGLLVPRLTTAQRTNVAFTSVLTVTENGLLVFDSDENQFYFWNSGSWDPVMAPVGTGPNQIVQLDSSGALPAVDGSQITGVSPSFASPFAEDPANVVFGSNLIIPAPSSAHMAAEKPPYCGIWRNN